MIEIEHRPANDFIAGFTANNMKESFVAIFQGPIESGQQDSRQTMLKKQAIALFRGAQRPLGASTPAAAQLQIDAGGQQDAHRQHTSQHDDADGSPRACGRFLVPPLEHALLLILHGFEFTANHLQAFHFILPKLGGIWNHPFPGLRRVHEQLEDAKSVFNALIGPAQVRQLARVFGNKTPQTILKAASFRHARVEFCPGPFVVEDGEIDGKILRVLNRRVSLRSHGENLVRLVDKPVDLDQPPRIPVGKYARGDEHQSCKDREEDQFPLQRSLHTNPRADPRAKPRVFDPLGDLLSYSYRYEKRPTLAF
jgi:hypothetical protein